MHKLQCWYVRLRRRAHKFHLLYCLPGWSILWHTRLYMHQLRRWHVQPQHRTLFMLHMPLRLVPGQHWKDLMQQLPRWEVQLWDGPNKL
jgi:hypothetical protein